jgi:signal transduction histidine kinase/ActR/RegA family two-component response regulator
MNAAGEATRDGGGAAGWLLLRADGRVVAADPLAAALLGEAEPAALVGRALAEPLAAPASVAIAEALAAGRSWAGPIALAAGGELHAELTPTAAGPALLSLRTRPPAPDAAPGSAELTQLLAVHQALDALDDVEAAARAALQAAASVIRHDWSTVLLFDGAEARALAAYPSAMAGVDPGARWAPPDEAERILLDRGEPSLDGALERGADDRSPLARLPAFGMRSALRVPLFDGERVAGAALLFAARPGAFGAAEGLRLERLVRPLGLRLSGPASTAGGAGETGWLAALGEAVPGAAHELNNPLAAILGYAQIADALGEAERTQALAAIEREATRARRIVHTLLELARPQPDGRGPVSLEAVVRRVIEVRRYALSVDNVALRTRFEPLPPVDADERRLELALLELLASAHRAVGVAGGSIEVSTTLVEGHARLAVTDSGPGVPPGAEQRLFEASRPRLVGRGGPGLAEARTVAEEHGGRLLVERPPAGGARLVIELPLGDGEPTAAPPPVATPEPEPLDATPEPKSPAESTTSEPPASPAVPPAELPPTPPPLARLLVVDDDPTLRTLARELLRAEGYAVELAASTDEALALLASEPVDLVLADVQMPGRGGDELYAEIRARWPELVARTLFITGDLESERARRLFTEGGAPYLRKPFLRYELLEAVRTLLDRERPAPPEGLPPPSS